VADEDDLGGVDERRMPARRPVVIVQVGPDRPARRDGRRYCPSCPRREVRDDDIGLRHRGRQRHLVERQVRRSIREHDRDATAIGVHQVDVLRRPSRVEGRTQVDIGGHEALANVPTGVVVADPREERDVDTEASQIQGLPGGTATDRLVMPPRMDGRRVTVGQAIDVDHPIPGSPAQDRDAHQLAVTGTCAGDSRERPWSRPPATTTAIASVTTMTALNV
jgi:hypothetical protein